jgi:hypothetical protein
MKILIALQPPETSSLAQKVEAGKWIQQHVNIEIPKPYINN